jgi:hypothetical protein
MVMELNPVLRAKKKKKLNSKRVWHSWSDALISHRHSTVKNLEHWGFFNKRNEQISGYQIYFSLPSGIHLWHSGWEATGNPMHH